MKTKFKHFLIKGLHYGFPRGWGNGYVLIPVGHPMHGKYYDDIDVEVHGGLTFSELAEENMKEWSGGKIIDEDLGSWIVGFDTAHYGDNETNWGFQNVEAETIRLKEQLENIVL
jgi:hypothetical protein